jgi:hypothetical protein
MGWWDFADNTGYPGNDLAVHRLECPFCEEKGNFSTVNHFIQKHSATKRILNYDIMRCGNCSTLMMVFWSSAIGGFTARGMHDFRCVPWPRKTTKFPDHWPPDVGRYWLQARRSLEAKNWDAAAVMARSAVQLTARYNGAKGSNLKQEIDDLGTKGLLPPVMVEWSHEIRVLGNESAHPKPGDTGTKQKDATDIVEFLGQLLLVVYDLPHQIGQYRARKIP